MGPVGVDRGERRDERLGTLPEPRHPVGVGIRTRLWVRRRGFERSLPRPAMDTPEVSRETGKIPTRTRCDRGVERTTLERYHKSIDVGHEVVDVRLGDHGKRR